MALVVPDLNSIGIAAASDRWRFVSAYERFVDSLRWEFVRVADGQEFCIGMCLRSDPGHDYVAEIRAILAQWDEAPLARHVDPLTSWVRAQYRPRKLPDSPLSSGGRKA